jgi:hypothetical protein
VVCPLTDIAIKKAKITEKPYRLKDSGGMFLFVTPSPGRMPNIDAGRGVAIREFSLGCGFGETDYLLTGYPSD